MLKNRLSLPIITREFDRLWAEYPNRQGKKAAFRHFRATVKTEKDIIFFEKAMQNYLTSGNVKRGYIKNGSSFFNQWEDWIDPTPMMMLGNGVKANENERTLKTWAGI